MIKTLWGILGGVVLALLAVFGLRSRNKSLADTALDLAAKNKKKSEKRIEKEVEAKQSAATVKHEQELKKVEKGINDATDGDDDVGDLVDYINSEH